MNRRKLPAGLIFVLSFLAIIPLTMSEGEQKDYNAYLPGSFPAQVSSRVFVIPLDPAGLLVVIPAGLESKKAELERRLSEKCGQPKQITSGGSPCYPCWSPDGRWIAYLDRKISSDKKRIATIFKIPAEGGEVQKITTESDNVTRAGLDWAPDGKTIAYFSKKADTAAGTLNLVPVAGGESREVCRVQNIRAHDDLSWSPEGKKIAYASQGKIWVVPAEGGEPVEVKTDVDADAGTLDWSPDGRKIAFSGESGMDIEF